MILATAGHIDHGKTALIRALTGVDADRLPEEKKRGLTIDLGFAYATLPDGSELGFVDVPGHERFLPNMLAGVLSIDRVLLVVAADDGPRPQTIEHLDILELIGVAEVTGVVTKIDRVAPERIAEVVGKIEELLAAAGYAESPIFRVSSRTGDGVAALIRHLEKAAAIAAVERAEAIASGLFRMPIDRAFTLPGIGLVVTGTVAAGAVGIGDRLTVSPGGATVRVRGLHGQNRPIENASAGERCAVNIVGSFSEGAEPRRGDWLVAPERHLPARLELLEAMMPADPSAALARLLAAEGFVDLANFGLVRNLAAAELEALSETESVQFIRVGPARAPVAVTPARLAAFADTIVDTLASWHQAQPDSLGPTRPALVMRLRATEPEAALDAALTHLAAAGRAVREGGMWRL